MLKKRIGFFYLCCAIILCGNIVVAQTKTQKKMRILFIFDASNSMKGALGPKTKMEHAKEMFNRFIDSMGRHKNYEFALRMYGSTVAYPPGDCKDSKLVVPFSKNNIPQIKLKVKEAKPTGITPIEHSLTSSANDFPDQNADNIVILITDGIEECGGDPCAAKAQLEAKGIVIHPFIIGIGLTKQQVEAFNCVGKYFDGEDLSVWKQIEKPIVEIEKSKTTSQINLLDIGSKPSETNVNMTIYDQKTGNMLFNYLHSLNSKGNPDTIHTLREGRTYRIVVNTIPPVEKKNVLITANKHNIIPIDCPQGFINIYWATQKNYMVKQDLKVKSVVRKSGDLNTLHVQNLNTTEKYIVGTYDLEVMTLPRTILKDVKVNQTLEKNIEIPLPGVVGIKLKEAGEGCILKEENGKLVHVINLDKNKTQQVYNLQPGTYRVEYRARSQKQTIFSIERKFTVESEKEYLIDLVSQ
jgi:Ca-activated chloride channel homolog